MPVTYCFDYYHFVIQCEIKTGNNKCCKIKDIANQGLLFPYQIRHMEAKSFQQYQNPQCLNVLY